MSPQAESGADRVLVYSFNRCSTCRKAIAWLNDRHIPFTLIDISADPPGIELLDRARQQLGGLSGLFNTSGQSYRSLGAANVKAMDDTQALEALAADGKLIKRPFVQTANGRFLIGFRPREWEAELSCSFP
jgi:arsenate reductase